MQTINVLLDDKMGLEKQVKNVKLDKPTTFFIDKMASFYPLINVLKNRIRGSDKVITFTCLPYSGTQLFRANINKYTLQFKGNQFKAYVDDKRIQLTDNIICDNVKELDHDFVLDLFRLSNKLKRYDWHAGKVCDFHENKSSAGYGPLSGYYERIKDGIVKVVSNSGCCNYSGGESYYDIYNNKVLYSDCYCRLDRDKIDKILCNC